MFPCEPVDLSFLDADSVEGRFLFRNSVDLAITPEQLFEVFADAESWPRWVKAIAKVTWTSPEPHGVGTTRTVEGRGGMVGKEEFLAWESFSRIAFRFNECSTRAIAALAEDYRVEAIPGGCRLTWIMALKAAGPARLAMPLISPLFNLVLRRFLHNLRGYTDARFAAAQQP
jgi:Polyketide cyclase / dehydrase and lipid transport